MAEITTAGYLQLRTGTPVDDWFIEFRNGASPIPITADPGPGTVGRLSGADARVTVTDDAGTQTTTFTAVLGSADVGASPGSPVTVDGVVLFAAVSGGSALTAVETFDPFVFSDPDDEVTISQHVEVPEQA